MESFTRQRRNLILISLVLIATRLVDLTLDVDQFSVFRNTLHMSRPFDVRWVLWVFGLYWVFRCYQAMRELRRERTTFGIGQAIVKARVDFAFAVAGREWKPRAVAVARAAMPDVAIARVTRVLFNPVQEMIRFWSVDIATNQATLTFEDREHCGPLVKSYFCWKLWRDDFPASCSAPASRRLFVSHIEIIFSPAASTVASVSSRSSHSQAGSAWFGNLAPCILRLVSASCSVWFIR